MLATVEELHVLPHEPTGGWVVGGSGDAGWFATAGEAEHAAQSLAVEAGVLVIYVHDRYHRVRTLAAAT